MCRNVQQRVEMNAALLGWQPIHPPCHRWRQRQRRPGVGAGTASRPPLHGIRQPRQQLAWAQGRAARAGQARALRVMAGGGLSRVKATSSAALPWLPRMLCGDVLHRPLFRHGCVNWYGACMTSIAANGIVGELCTKIDKVMNIVSETLRDHRVWCLLMDHTLNNACSPEPASCVSRTMAASAPLATSDSNAHVPCSSTP